MSPSSTGSRKRSEDGLHTPHELELGHVIDHVDVVDTLGAVLIALVDGIDAHIAGLAARLGLAPVPDGAVCRLGLGHYRAPALICRRPAQIVQVTVRQSRQTLETDIAEHLVLAPHQRPRRRPRHLAHRRVPREVVLDPDRIEHPRIADELRELFAPVGPVEPGRNEHRDPPGRDPGVKVRQA